MPSLPNPDAETWFGRRTFPSTRNPGRRALPRPQSSPDRIAVCLPALDERETIGDICTTIRSDLVDRGIVDELIVMDSGSADGTAEVAAGAGARVVATTEILPDHLPTTGKGVALWKSLAATNAEIIVWIDSDIREFDASFVTSLIDPMIRHPELVLCKGFYERPLRTRSGDGSGARVTELAARPLLNLLFPELAGVIQPLGGEYAVRRDAMFRLPFFAGYGVDVGLLIDAAFRCGIDRIAQIDLGRRLHRNRGLDELGRTAHEVLHAILARAEDLNRIKFGEDLCDRLVQFTLGDDGPRRHVHHLPLRELPPIGSLGY